MSLVVLKKLLDSLLPCIAMAHIFKCRLGGEHGSVARAHAYGDDKKRRMLDKNDRPKLQRFSKALELLDIKIGITNSTLWVAASLDPSAILPTHYQSKNLPSRRTYEFYIVL